MKKITKRLGLKAETISVLALSNVVGGISGDWCTTAHTWQCTTECTSTDGPSGTGTLNSHFPCPP